MLCTPAGMVCFQIQNLWAVEYLLHFCFCFDCSTRSWDPAVCRVCNDCRITNANVLSPSQQTNITQSTIGKQNKNRKPDSRARENARNCLRLVGETIRFLWLVNTRYTQANKSLPFRSTVNRNLLHFNLGFSVFLFQPVGGFIVNLWVLSTSRHCFSSWP